MLVSERAWTPSPELSPLLPPKKLQQPGTVLKWGVPLLETTGDSRILLVFG